MKFSDVLASSVHDIKNSLSMVLNTLDVLMHDPETKFGDPQKAFILQQETQRANSNLIQLLTLYKIEKQQLSPNLLEQNTDDFLEEIQAENQALLNAQGIELTYECDPLLSGYFDESLVRGVMNSSIGNAGRYTKSKILISASNEDGYLVFRIEDDGTGFPAHMLESLAAQEATNASRTEHTQLGLFFANEVAELHTAGERKGFIKLKNGHSLAGGCFELWLP